MLGVPSPSKAGIMPQLFEDFTTSSSSGMIPTDEGLILEHEGNATYYHHMLDLSQTWGYFPALILQVVNTFIALPLMAVLIHQRNRFPIKATPVLLLVITQVLAPFASLCYTNMFLFPRMPCWLQIVVSGGIYMFASPAIVNVAWLWFTYNLQYHLSQGNVNSFFSRHSYLVKDTRYILISSFTLMAITAPFSVSRYVGKSAEVLDAPFVTKECSELTLLQLLAKAASSGATSTAGVTLALALKDIQEAFHLKRQYKKICLLFFVTAPVVVGPWFMRPFLPVSLYLNLLILGQLTWALGIFCYSYWLPVYLARVSFWVMRFSTHRGSSSKTASFGMTPNSVGGVQQQMNRNRGEGSPLFHYMIKPGKGGPTTDFDLNSWQSVFTNIEKVCTVHELRECLSAPETRTKFKEYLVKEFCVENMLFIMAVTDFQRIDDPFKRLESVKELCANYIADNSLFQINISEGLRSGLLKAVSSSDPTSIPKNFFAKAEEEVYRIMIDPFNRLLHRERMMLANPRKSVGAGHKWSFFAKLFGGGSGVSGGSGAKTNSITKKTLSVTPTQMKTTTSTRTFVPAARTVSEARPGGGSSGQLVSEHDKRTASRSEKI